MPDSSIATPEEEQVREAVARTERSFGATFKRLKSENEELRARAEEARTEFEAAKAGMERRISELGELAADREKRLSEIAVDGEITRQLGATGPLPERFIDRAAIGYADDPEELKTRVATVLERGRADFETALAEAGIDRQQPESRSDGQRLERARPVNPTNPPSRDALTARNLRHADARDALLDMARRGLIRR